MMRLQHDDFCDVCRCFSSLLASSQLALYGPEQVRCKVRTKRDVAVVTFGHADCQEQLRSKVRTNA